MNVHVIRHFLMCHLSQGYYERRVKEGKMPKPKPRSQMTPEELTAIRERGRVFQARRRGGEEAIAKLRQRTGHERLKSGPVKGPPPPPGPGQKKSMYLKIYLDEHPDIRRVEHIRHWTTDEQQDFQRWKYRYRFRTEEDFRKRVRDGWRKWDAAHREARAEKARSRRLTARQHEIKYNESFRGRLKRYMYDLRRQADVDKVPMTLAEEDVVELSDGECYYCGDVIEHFGVDILDPAAGYIRENAVGCCTICNKARKDHDWRDFVRVMCNIAKTHNQDLLWEYDYTFKKAVKDVGSAVYSKYMDNAKRRNLDFVITVDEFQTLTSRPCYYCARHDRNVGLDRIDSSMSYTLDNVVPSCGTCNLMKNKLPQCVFLDKAQKVFSTWMVEHDDDDEEDD